MEEQYGGRLGNNLWRKILQEGDGLETPNYRSKCKVKITRLHKSGKMDDTYLEDRVIGEGDSDWSEMIDSCIESMHKGEVWQVTTDLSDEGDNDKLLCQYEIELQSFERAKDVYSLPSQEMLELAEHHKGKGTDHFKAGRSMNAARQYSRALKLLIMTGDELQDNQTTHYEQLKLACYLNLAACQGKMSRYDHVVANCSKVLQKEEANMKALYRRGQANMCLNEFSQARQDLEKALHFEPKNKSIREALSVLKNKEHANDAAFAKALAPMFSRR